MYKVNETYNRIRSFIIDALAESGPNFLWYDPQYEIRGLMWRIHKNDDDTLPSVPHLHAIEKPYKLDVYNGRIYDAKTNKHAISANQKQLHKLWRDEKMVSIIMDYRKRYKDKYTLPDIPSYAIEVADKMIIMNAEQYEFSFEE